jgi:2-keto-3-deoxy-L-rhamnonate aldolase RhmA
MRKWVLIDCEHGNIADNEMYLACGAIMSAGVSPIVRVPADEAWMVKRALDAGAHGIMVPMCDNKVRLDYFPLQNSNSQTKVNLGTSYRHC